MSTDTTERVLGTVWRLEQLVAETGSWRALEVGPSERLLLPEQLAAEVIRERVRTLEPKGLSYRVHVWQDANAAQVARTETHLSAVVSLRVRH